MPNRVESIAFETDLDELCLCISKKSDPSCPGADGRICMNLVVGDSGRKSVGAMGDETKYIPSYEARTGSFSKVGKEDGDDVWAPSDVLAGTRGSGQGFITTTSAPSKIFKTLAEKYLTTERNFRFGIHYNQETRSYRIGQFPVSFDGNDILVKYGNETMRYRGTDGLWRLLTQDTIYHDDLKYFTAFDWVVYMEIMLRANPAPKQAEISKYSDESELLKDILGCVGCAIADYLVKKLDAALDAAVEWFGDKVKDVAGGIYGKLGQLGSKIYDYLASWWPSSKKPDPGKDKDIFEELDFVAGAYIKDMDELLRRLVSLQKLKMSQKMYCGFTQSCLLFWIIQRIVAALGRKGGAELLIDWTKINNALLVETSLLKKLSFNLPFGYHHNENPLCGPTPSEENAVKRGSKSDTACVVHDEKYFSFQKPNPKMEKDIRVGMRLLDRLFLEDPYFFEKMDVFTNISTKDLNTALDRGFRYLQSYYSSDG